jgi:hypothetical protein
MNGRRLKLYLFSCLLLLLSFAAQAQDLHFIYIQTENQKPFYIKIDGQTIPSSVSGYIILSRLTQGSYKSYIGFPKTELPELVINFIVNDADAGYLLRNDIDQGLYMVDLQTKKFIPTEMRWPVVKNTIKSKDEFARILSEVVNDSSISEITGFTKTTEAIVKSEAIKTLSTSTVVQPQTVIKNSAEVIVDNKGVITKLLQKNTEGGFSVLYLDNADTIDVLIPTNKIQTQITKEEKTDSLIITNKEKEADKEVKFINMELRNPHQQADSSVTKKDDFVISEKKNVAAKASEMNQRDSLKRLKVEGKRLHADCKKIATQTDFLNLRKKMAAEKTASGMRLLAGKQFNNACLSTEQIKNLGLLFITEEERYKFYVSAYPYVSDAANFATLENQLADSYYITRFKAMLQH